MRLKSLLSYVPLIYPKSLNTALTKPEQSRYSVPFPCPPPHIYGVPSYLEACSTIFDPEPPPPDPGEPLPPP